MSDQKNLRRKLDSLSEIEIATLYKKLFTSTDGQLVLEHLKSKSFVYDTTAGQHDPHLTYFNEGMRSICLHINNIVNMDLDQIQPSEVSQYED